MATVTYQGLEVLYTHQQIADRVAQMGAQISHDLNGEKLVMVGVLKGAAIFLSDLARAIHADATFDFVYGVAILHHLDFPVALAEIARVTKPGGRILFVEPLRLNPVAQLVRLLTPKARTPDELPLAREELRIIEKYFEPEYLFTDMFHLPVALLSQFLFKDPVNPLTRAGDAVDRAVVSAFPGLGVFYRTITILGRKRA